jgi:hypothetical protein
MNGRRQILNKSTQISELIGGLMQLRLMNLMSGLQVTKGLICKHSVMDGKSETRKVCSLAGRFTSLKILLLFASPDTSKLYMKGSLRLCKMRKRREGSLKKLREKENRHRYLLLPVVSKFLLPVVSKSLLPVVSKSLLLKRNLMKLKKMKRFMIWH